MTTIGAVVFDLDGVIRDWPRGPVGAIERALGLPAGSIEGVAFESPLIRPMLLGQVSRHEWQDDVAEALAVDFGPPGREAVDRWARLDAVIDARAVELVAEVRRQRPVALLSNGDRGLRLELRELGLEAAFDAICISAELGVAKPDEEAFRQAAASLHHDPASCLVIDDAETNISAAAALGMPGIEHRSWARTRRAMARLGLVCA